MSMVVWVAAWFQWNLLLHIEFIHKMNKKWKRHSSGTMQHVPAQIHCCMIWTGSHIEHWSDEMKCRLSQGRIQPVKLWGGDFSIIR